jgi:lipopolysaccharide transport system permease protein
MDSTAQIEKLVIKAGRTERHYWRDLWRYRELFYFLAWRDMMVRYKQTVVGVAWAVIRPILTIAVLSLVFGRLGKLDSGGVPTSLLVCCGVIPWQFFGAALSECGNSLVSNSNLISKIYFPRLIVPASSVITSFVDFLVSAAILIFLMVWYRFMPPPQILALPLFVLLAFAASLGAGLWIAALMVDYRDFRVIVPFMIQFGLYATPVAYMTSTFIPAKWRLLYSVNPLVGVIDGFRWSILGGKNDLYLPGLVFSVVGITLMLASGIWYFRKTEKSFADVI